MSHFEQDPLYFPLWKRKDQVVQAYEMFSDTVLKKISGFHFKHFLGD